MKRARCAVALSLSLASCAAMGPIEPPQPGDEVPDARAATQIARQLCEVPPIEVWLSPRRRRVERQGGNRHVHVPAMRYALDKAHVDVDIRAADGTTLTRRIAGCDPTVVIEGAN